VKKCAFCTRVADSREHIFSEWMIKMLPRNQQFLFRERLKNGELKTYKGKKVKLKAKVVCGHCNNNWMSELENSHAKPAMQSLLMGNSSALLHTKEIVALAIYAFKTTVLANHKDLKATPFFTSSQRFKFRSTLRIPEGVQIWIACRKSSYTTNGRWTSKFGKFNRKTADTFSYYVCTWNFQNIILQTVAGKWDEKRRRNTIPFPGLAQPIFWKDASIPLWPADGNHIEWPPPLYIGDNMFDAFCDRWDTTPSAL
jgi:hypothetical protein